MDIQSILYFQIVADVVLCAAMVILLWRSGRKGGRKGTPALDEQSLRQFRKLLDESQAAAERFILTIDEGYRKFRELAVDLDKREHRLQSLIEEMNKRTKGPENRVLSDDETGSRARYEATLKYLDEGLPLEEVARRTGLTSGEIVLISELEKIRQVKTG
jgi:hypothetical protein